MAFKGKNLFLRLLIGSSYTTIAGLQSKSVAINQESVDITTDDDLSWRRLMGGTGLASISISAQGIFKNDAAMNLVNAMAFGGEIGTFQLLFDNGDTIDGSFQVTSFEYSADYTNALVSSVSLESAGLAALTRYASPYTLAVLADSPLGYWKAGDSGSTVIDYNGNYDGTLNASYTRGVTALVQNAGDEAVFINGGHQIEGGFETGSFGVMNFPATLECWVSVTTLSSIQYLMHTHMVIPEDIKRYGFNLIIQTTGAVQSWVGSGSDFAPEKFKGVRTSSGLIGENITYYIVAVFASLNDMKIYIDADEKSVTPLLSGTQLDTSTGTGSFGRGNEGVPGIPSSMNGTLDELAIYDTALNLSQIQAHYNAGI
jgi:TP901-1 family phage major tail protein